MRFTVRSPSVKVPAVLMSVMVALLAVIGRHMDRASARAIIRL